ncbi:30S ribosomal protein S15 [Desulfurobacterium indicum]|uniref:Small ribosomal subunit protein uS15 n=1 Tax=Desulfurobacterium indicum TaxID=1914305 RepID=A0A1R1MLD9_9BACT|nr:30S ribosomal protein S15 [Desulfurobacterium indicum]OMH40632.1 30S ribosomal protein S15 [Desulfurobacterium indicum]
MAVDKDVKQEIIKKYGFHEKDTGSPEVQIALLTERIKILTEHFKEHKHDNNNKRALYKLVGRRKRLLRYLKEKDFNRYKNIVLKLGLRK